MAGGLRAHLRRRHLHHNRLEMPGLQTQTQQTQCIQMTQQVCGQYQVAWCNTGQHKVQHVRTIAHETLMCCGMPKLVMPMVQQQTPSLIMSYILVQYPVYILYIYSKGLLSALPKAQWATAEELCRSHMHQMLFSKHLTSCTSSSASNCCKSKQYKS